MDEYHPIDRKFREAFDGFEQEPPERAWNRLRNHVRLEPAEHDFWSKVIALHRTHPRSVRIAALVTVLLLIVVLTVIRLTSRDYQMIHGSAWAGEERLCRGTAYLFKVDDKILPYDTVRQYQSVPINEKGQYCFPQVEPGRYLLQVSPDETSAHSQTFIPSWFDQRSPKESPKLIEVIDEDLMINLILRQR
jgi:hypothetical protein